MTSLAVARGSASICLVKWYIATIKYFLWTDAREMVPSISSSYYADGIELSLAGADRVM